MDQKYEWKQVETPYTYCREEKHKDAFTLAKKPTCLKTIKIRQTNIYSNKICEKLSIQLC